MAGIRSGLDRRQAKNNENILFVPTVVLLTQGIAKNWGRASMRQKKAIEQKTTDLACTVIHTGAQRGKKPKASELLSTLRYIVLSDWKGFGLTHFVLLHSNLVANRWIPSSRGKRPPFRKLYTTIATLSWKTWHDDCWWSLKKLSESFAFLQGSNGNILCWRETFLCVTQ